MRRVLRGLARAVGWTIVVVLALIVGAVALLLSPPGERFLARQVVSLLGGVLCDGCSLDEPGLKLDLLPGRLVLRDVAFRGPDGDVLIGVGGLDADLDLWALLSGTAHVPRLRLDDVRVAMQFDEAGNFNLVRLFSGPADKAPPAPVDPDAPPWGGLPITIAVDDLHLSDGMVWLWTAPGDDQQAVFDARVLDLAARHVVLPDHDPGVRVDVEGLLLDGVLLSPGPVPLSLDGDGAWTGEGVVGDPLVLRALATSLTAQGEVRELFDEGRFDLTATVEPVDLALVDHLFGAGIGGRYAGTLHAVGSFGDLSIDGALSGVDGTRGTLTLAPGSRVCLPGVPSDPDPCGVLPGQTPSRPAPGLGDPEGPPLRWTADVSLDGFALEDVLPVVGGPLVLEGRLRARGGGTSWPDGVFVEDGSWKARDLDVFGFPIREVDVGVGLRRGVLSLRPLHAGAGGVSLDGRGTVDLVRGGLDVEASGALVPRWLADVGLEGVTGEGSLTASVHGELFEDGVPIGITASLDATDLAWLDIALAQTHAEAEVTVLNGIVDVGVAVAATDVDAYGASTRRVASDDVTVHVADGATTVHLTATSPELFHEIGAYAEDVVAEVSVDVPAEGDVAVDVAARLGAHEAWGLQGTLGRARFGLVGDVMGLDVALDHEAGAFLHVDGMRYDLVTGRVDVRRLELAPKHVGSPAPVLRWVSSRPLAVVVGEHGLPLVDVGLRDPSGGGIDLSGSLVTQGPLDAAIDISQLPAGLFDLLFPAAEVGVEGVVTVQGAVSGDASEPVGQVTIDVRGLTIPDLSGADGLWTDGLDLRGTVGVGGDVLAVDLTAGSAAERAMVALSGALPVRSDLTDPGLRPQGPVDVRVELAPGPYARLTDVVPLLGALPEGQASGLLRVSGDLHDPDLDLQAVADLRVAGLVQRTRLEVDLRRRAGDLTVLADVYEGLSPVVRVDGRARTRLGEVMDWLLAGGPEPGFDDAALYANDLDVTAQLADIPVQTVLGLTGSTLGVQGPIAGEIRVVGDPVRPRIDASVHADLTVDDDPLPIKLCLRRPGAGVTAVGGRRISLRGMAAGPLRSRLGASAVDRCDVELAGHTDAQTYGAFLQLGPQDFPWLTAKGAVPVAIDLSRDVKDWGTTLFDVDVQGLGVPLVVLGALDPELRGEAGAVVLAGHLGGTLVNPQPSLTVDLEHGVVLYRPLGLRMEQMTLHGDIIPRAGEALYGGLDLVLSTLSAVTRPQQQSLETVLAGNAGRKGPSIQGDAVLHLREWAPDDLEARLSLSNAWLLATSDSRLQVGGEVQVGGRYPALDIDGALEIAQGRLGLNTSDLLASRSEVVDGRLRICRRSTVDPVCTQLAVEQARERLAEGSSERVGLDARLAVTRTQEPSPQPTPVEEAPGVYESMDLDVALSLGRGLQADVQIPVLEDFGSFGASLTRATIDARVGGNLDVAIHGGQLSLVGDVEVIDGRVGVLRSKFDIKSGSRATFLGEDYANPQLDIGGSMEVTGGSVQLTLRGTPLAPELELTSEEFGSDAELFTILLTGQAPDDLSGSEGLGAAQALGDLLLNSVLGGVNLGSVSVEGDGTVRIGLPVARTLYVESLFDPTPRLNENRVRVSAEWSILPKLLVTAAYGDRLVEGGLAWETRFDGPGRAKAAAARQVEERVKAPGRTVIGPRRVVAPAPPPPEEQVTTEEEDPEGP